MHLIIVIDQQTGTVIKAAHRKLGPAVFGLVVTLEGQLSGTCLAAFPLAAVIACNEGLRALRDNTKSWCHYNGFSDLARHLRDDFQYTVRLSSVLRLSKIVFFDITDLMG
jgi:hypothetical protein